MFVRSDSLREVIGPLKRSPDDSAIRRWALFAATLLPWTAPNLCQAAAMLSLTVDGRAQTLHTDNGWEFEATSRFEPRDFWDRVELPEFLGDPNADQTDCAECVVNSVPFYDLKNAFRPNDIDVLLPGSSPKRKIIMRY